MFDELHAVNIKQFRFHIIWEVMCFCLSFKLIILINKNGLSRDLLLFDVLLAIHL